MTIVYGQIESLNKVKDTLTQEGITRFSSIGEINAFYKSYDSEYRDIETKTENALDGELDELRVEIKSLKHKFEYFSNNEVVELQLREDAKKEQIRALQAKEFKNIFIKIVIGIKILFQKLTRYKIERKILSTTRRETKLIKKQLSRTKEKYDRLRLNKASILKQRSSRALKELEHTKQVLDSLQPWIAGAIGENKVKRELEKLPDNNYLFNDLSLYFKPPIYNRKEKDKIFSIQVDHLLVSQAGVFIIETKNWSKVSLANLDMRSPVQQIRRTSFAIFVLLNKSQNKGPRLHFHHWGEKEIPVYNLIAMINHKPKEIFKHVTIKTLNELQSYITYFDPIFTDKEVYRIANYFLRLQNHYQSRRKKSSKY